MILNVKNETSLLKAVVLGYPGDIGKTPALNETYDAKSYDSVLNNVYPTEEGISKEMSAFEKVLLKHDVHISRPWSIENCNQIFTRDNAFVIEDKIINSNIIPERIGEKEAYEDIYDQISYRKIYNLPDKAHVEGGDVVLYNDIVFLGIYTGPDYSKYKTARTNTGALHFLEELFPEKRFIPLEMKKNDTNPYEGVLHLDYAFMPVGKNKAIIYKDAFAHEDDYKLLTDIFGLSNLFNITREEMYNMTANVFSISPSVVVSESNFTRLNKHMEEKWGLEVETVPYHEISKIGGLFRSSTIPLIRSNE